MNNSDPNVLEDGKSEHTGWGKDWDETDFSGSAIPWIAAAKFAPYDSTMHDEPQVAPFYNVKSVFFEAVSRVKCIEGKEKGTIYATVDWYYAAKNGRPDLEGNP